MVAVATLYVKWSEQNQIEKDAKFQKFLEFEKFFEEKNEKYWTSCKQTGQTLRYF